MSNLKSNANSPSPFQTAIEAVLNEKNVSTFHRAIWLDRLDHQLRSHLPETLANQCRLANVNGKNLFFWSNHLLGTQNYDFPNLSF